MNNNSDIPSTLAIEQEAVKLGSIVSQDNKTEQNMATELPRPVVNIVEPVEETAEGIGESDELVIGLFKLFPKR